MITRAVIKPFSGFQATDVNVWVSFTFLYAGEIVQKGERIICGPSAHQLNPANEQEGFTQHVLANNGQVGGIFLMPMTHL